MKENIPILLYVYNLYISFPQCIIFTGSIWEIFEYAPAGISSAAVMRVGIHLGNGNPRMAKIAAYKTLLYSLIWSSLASALFIHLQDEIIGLFTEDETLTGMLQSLVLLISFGNVFMCMGGSAWHIITAQSRTKLATKLFFTCMWCITIPLSAVFVFVFSYNLEALVSAMVLGYSTLSFALLYCKLNACVLGHFRRVRMMVGVFIDWFQSLIDINFVVSCFFLSLQWSLLATGKKLACG